MTIFHFSYILLLYMLPHVSSTEISVDTFTIDRSLDIEIQLPVLTCHPRHKGYNEVSWYKDYVLLKKGHADLSDHFLALSTLLKTNSSTVGFENPLELQGYYWCETDHTMPPTIFDYLFRIKEVHTFVGKFISTRDFLGTREKLTKRDKIVIKKSIYEEEMQNILFGFLPIPNVYVTDIKELKQGLEVRFFLYARQVLHPRKPIDDELELDQNHLQFVVDYINNETSVVEPQLHYESADWADFRGIKTRDIVLKSTLGCYPDITMMYSDPPSEVTWQSARIGSIVIPDSACVTKDGLAVTRICTGSFYRGATWGKPSGICDKPPQGVTQQLKDLYDAFGSEDRGIYIEKLKTLMRYPSELDVTGLHLATEILKEISRMPKLDPQELNGIISVVDQMVDTNRTQLDTAKSTLHLTSRILEVFDNLLGQASEEKKEIKISKQHILVDTKYTDAAGDHLLGFAVTSPSSDISLKNGSIEFVLNSSKLPFKDAIAYFALPMDLVASRESLLAVPCQVNMVFFKDWFLFQTPKEVLVKRNYKVVPTPVMYVSISGGPAWNLTNPVQLFIKDMLHKEVENPVCVYYDPRLDDGIGSWSKEGCEYGGLVNGFHNCRCHHLSIFAVILSEHPGTRKELQLSTSVYVGSGVSILALSFVVILFLLSKHWRATVDQCILFCLSLSSLICIILVFISEIHFLTKQGCMLLALIFHYTIFAIFGWLLVLAVVYKLRFTKKTDLNEVPHFMIKAALSVWGSPIVIIIIIWLSKEYSIPDKDNCWLTVSEVSFVSVIPMVVLILVTLCVNTCAIYAVTCRFRKDFLIGESSPTEDVVKFRVAFTIYCFYLLTWLFGFFALQKKSKELQILFSITFTLTAYYVCLFFVFHEMSLWEMCKKWNRGKKEENELPVVKMETKSYKTIDEPKEAEEK